MKSKECMFGDYPTIFFNLGSYYRIRRSSNAIPVNSFRLRPSNFKPKTLNYKLCMNRCYFSEIMNELLY